MAKVWKAIRSTLAVLLTLALVFSAGYFVGSFPDEEAEIVEPINPAEEKFDLELPAEVEKRIVTVEEVEVMLVDISQFSTYSGEYTTTKSAEYTRYFLDNIAVPGTTNTINLECKGIVKVGYDVEEITIEVDNDSKKIYISLPAPKFSITTSSGIPSNVRKKTTSSTPSTLSNIRRSYLKSRMMAWHLLRQMAFTLMRRRT